MSVSLPAVPGRHRRAHVLSWTLSIGVHLAIAAGIGWLAFRTLRAREAAELAAAAPHPVAPLTLPEVSEGSLLADEVIVEEGAPPEPAGGARTPRLDDGVRGHGGAGRAPSPAIHLNDRDEAITLTPDLVSHLDRDQQQRLRTASDRASWEDRRSTTNPTELTFLASGEGQHPERRPLADRDPSRGVRAAEPARALGGAIGAEASPADGDAARVSVGASQPGTRTRSPGVGVASGRAGADHRASADAAHARPSVVTAPVSIPATEHSRERDDVDSEQAVAQAVRSIVHASTSGGALGAGNGGTSGGGPAGAGGERGPGSHAPPLGPGGGEWFDLDTHDPRLMPYFRSIHAKVQPLWANAFPKSAMLELKQGTVILEFTVERDGTARVSWPPIRPSGIDAFDRNCADAIRRASPFAPIPRELGRNRIRIRAPFTAKNPIVK